MKYREVMDHICTVGERQITKGTLFMLRLWMNYIVVQLSRQKSKHFIMN